MSNETVKPQQTAAAKRKKRNILIGISAIVVVAIAIVAAVVSSAPKKEEENVALPAKIRIGYFANVTHSAALVALQKGYFEKNLPGVTIETAIFNAGPAAVEALKGDALDITFIGPNPSISGYATTDGELLRIVSGATSGGAQFIVQPDITEETLAGKNFATPQLGNTQDVALKDYLTSKGLTYSAGGDVTITPTDNATTLALFQKGEIDGAWVSEPWASRLVLEGNGKVLVDEATLWKNGQFVTTNIAALTSFLEKYPAAVEGVLKANLQAINYISKHPENAKALVQAQLQKDTGKKLSEEVLNRAFGNLEFTYQPLANTLEKNANGAVEAGVLKLNARGINNIYDLSILNKILAEQGLDPVSSAGLGKE